MMIKVTAEKRLDMARFTHFHVLTFFIASFYSPLCFAGKSGIMAVGTVLSTNSSLLTPSGDFSFGLHQIDTNTFVPAIWYTNIPDTVVWWAAGDGVHPNTGPQGSKLLLYEDQGLVLVDPQGNNRWRSPFNLGTVAYGIFNNTGNLVLIGTDGKYLWQSFEHPRNTLLPFQTMVVGGLEVFSKRSENNLSRGRFQINMENDGNLVLKTKSLNPLNNIPYGDDTVYYSSNTSASASNPGYMVDYNSSGHMYVLRKDGTEIDLLKGIKTPSPGDDYYFRATLNFDGVLAWYSHPKNKSVKNSGWSVIAYEPDNICVRLKGMNDSGACGYNGICTLVDGDYPRPNCSCPVGYSFVDPSDPFSMCAPSFKLGCKADEGYRMEKLDNTDWPLNDYEYLQPLTEDQCHDSCLNDCLCVASVFRDQGCWKKRYPLSNGRTNISIDQGVTAFLKVSNPNDDDVCPQCYLPNQNRMEVKLLASSLATSILIICLMVVCGIWFIKCRKYKGYVGVTKPEMEYNSVNCFSYRELEEATNGFKEELGRGACAVVYKGAIGRNLDGSQNLVAVKKIDLALLKEAEKEFTTEVNVVGQTHHKNLVKLIGFCKEEGRHLLVYEFMRNGCLADYLFGEIRPNWIERIKIAHGIARGLLYLHEECSTPIIHCDIKPQNILLDEYFNPKISDFGLSKLLMLNQFQTETGIRGTKGYVAPEWFRNKPVTSKVDVYSFGVVLLEIVSCRRSVLRDAMNEERAILTEWAIDCYLNETLDALVNDDMEALTDMERLKLFVKVAIWCTQEDPNLRPTMRQVNQMLEGLVEVPDPPCPDPNSLGHSNGANSLPGTSSKCEVGMF